MKRQDELNDRGPRELAGMVMDAERHIDNEERRMRRLAKRLRALADEIDPALAGPRILRKMKMIGRRTPK